MQALLRNKLLTVELRDREETARSFANPTATTAPVQLPEGSEAQNKVSRPRRLIVEDDVHECRLLEAYVQGMSADTQIVTGVQEALALLEQDGPDLVILDLLLPDGNGFTVVEQMRASARHIQTPILVVSSTTDVCHRVRALELGADDFIAKGSDRLEFEARLRRLLRMKRSLEQLARRCDQALQLAVTDSLTGLFTHGFLWETLHRQVACARRYEWPLSLLFIDIDHFKSINDRHGHAAGDEVLRHLSKAILTVVREGDTCVRYGGEEFVVLLPHTTRSGACLIADRIRVAAQTAVEQPSAFAPGGAPVTVSIGVATLPDDATDARALLERADAAMYQAKRAGRNQVVPFSESMSAAKTRSRLLLVDDDPKNLRLLEACLKSQGHELLTATDGEEAVAAAHREQPDLILMDGMMPRLSGFDACRMLKQDHRTCLIPIVLVTALNSREDKLRGVEAGADDFLTKPIDRTALIARVNASLRAKRSTDGLEDAETVILTLAKAVENRDPSTGGHVERVSHHAVTLGQAVGLPADQLHALRRAGIVHDIGKIAIPDAILLKPGKLTDSERKLMETHVEVGYEMLRPMRTFRDSLPAVRFHHERLNGSGYPLGLRGEQIPISAQIMAIVDVFDALTTDRVYRKALSHAEAFAVLRAEADRGLHDSRLIESFAQAVDRSAPAMLAGT